MAKRTRRKASEIEKLRNNILKVVQTEGRITLTDLVRQYGTSIGIRDTPSDKNLAKRQLDILAKGDRVNFRRSGRDLVAEYRAPEEEKPVEAPVAAPEAPGDGAPAAPTGTGGGDELDVIKAYALQVEEFSKSLQRQVSTLVRMVERATR